MKLIINLLFLFTLVVLCFFLTGLDLLLVVALQTGVVLLFGPAAFKRFPFKFILLAFAFNLAFIMLWPGCMTRDVVPEPSPKIDLFEEDFGKASIRFDGPKYVSRKPTWDMLKEATLAQLPESVREQTAKRLDRRLWQRLVDAKLMPAGARFDTSRCMVVKESPLRVDCIDPDREPFYDGDVDRPDRLDEAIDLFPTSINGIEPKISEVIFDVSADLSQVEHPDWVINPLRNAERVFMAEYDQDITIRVAYFRQTRYRIRGVLARLRELEKLDSYRIWSVPAHWINYATPGRIGQAWGDGRFYMEIEAISEDVLEQAVVDFSRARYFIRLSDTFALTWKWLLVIIDVSMRLFVILLGVYFFITIVSIQSLKMAMLRIGANELAYTLPITLNMLPILANTLLNTLTSFRMKGGFRRRQFRNSSRLFLNVLIQSVHIAEELSQAMEVNAEHLFRHEAQREALKKAKAKEVTS